MHSRMPEKITGQFLTPHGDHQKNFIQDRDTPIHGGIHEGGVYKDENDVRWVLKPSTPTEAIREVVASKIYRQQVGDEAAAEVELLTTPNSEKWIVASRWCDGLGPFDENAIGLEQMFTAACIIKDVDCIQKNIGLKNNNIFRYDFGAALRMDDLQQKEFLNATSIYEIISETGFSSITIMDKIDESKFIQLFKGLKQCQIEWSFWENLYEGVCPRENNQCPPNEHLKKQHTYIDERVEILKKLASYENNGLNLPITETVPCLIDFYKSIAPYVKPLIPNYEIVMAQKHLECLKTTGEHPVFYRDLIRKADGAKSLVKHFKKSSYTTSETNFYELIDKKAEVINNNSLLSKKLSKETVKKAIKSYVSYKDSFFYARWLSSSKESREAAQSLMQNQTDEESDLPLKK